MGTCWAIYKTINFPFCQTFNFDQMLRCSDCIIPQMAKGRVGLPCRSLLHDQLPKSMELHSWLAIQNHKLAEQPCVPITWVFRRPCKNTPCNSQASSSQRPGVSPQGRCHFRSNSDPVMSDTDRCQLRPCRGPLEP